MEILDYLQADLDALREMIFELRIADENTEHESEAFTALVSLVKAQSEAKASLFASISTPSLPSPLLNALHEVHERQVGAKNIEEIIECCSNRATWHASVTVYCELLEHQMQVELRELMPAMFDHIPHALRKSLGQSYQRLRGFGKFAQANERRHRRSVTDRFANSPQLSRWQKLWNKVITEAG